MVRDVVRSAPRIRRGEPRLHLSLDETSSLLKLSLACVGEVHMTDRAEMGEPATATASRRRMLHLTLPAVRRVFGKRRGQLALAVLVSVAAGFVPTAKSALESALF